MTDVIYSLFLVNLNKTGGENMIDSWSVQLHVIKIDFFQYFILRTKSVQLVQLL